MKPHYFLLDEVDNSPHGGLHVKSSNSDYPMPIDHFLCHFEEFSYTNFFNTRKHFMLDDRAYKFVLNFIHMPAHYSFPISDKTRDMLQTDPRAFLVLMSVLEYQIDPENLSRFCAGRKIPLNKVIVLCSNVEAHGQMINGIKYVCINYWESVSRWHHQLLPSAHVADKNLLERRIWDASKKFICLNRNVKPHRIWFMYAMIKADIVDQGHVSYHLPKINQNDYDTACNGHWVLKRIPADLHRDFLKTNRLKMFARMLDRLDEKLIIQYHNGPTKYYEDSVLSFVTESESSRNFITEKTYKAIANLHPFFIIGNPDQHALLRARGYETFEGLFGVNQITNYDEAMKMLNEMRKMDIALLKQNIIQKYLDKLIHNYDKFFSRRINWQTIVQEIFDATERR